MSSEPHIPGKNAKFIQRFIQKHAKNGRAPGLQYIEIFLKNLEWVARGLRPAFTPERVALHEEAFLKLLEEVVPLIITNAAVPAICMLSLEQHCFIVNVESCARHLDSITEQQLATTIIIDISKEQQHATVMTKDRLQTIMGVCTTISHSLQGLSHDTTIGKINITVDPLVNLCTIFGCILGYPIVYYFSGGQDGGNCLSMAPLNVVKILRRDCKNKSQLVSFSYPLSLRECVIEVINCWCAKFTSDKSIIVKQDVVEMPFIAL